MPDHLSEGIWNEIPEILAELMAEDEKTVEPKERWYDLNKIGKWLTTEPEITDKDLRPYYYACKEKIDYFSGAIAKNDLSEIVDLLFRDEMAIAGRIDDLKNLTNQEAEQVLDVVAQKIMEKGQFDAKPQGIAGIIMLVQSKPEFRKNLIGFIETLPADKVGVWVTSGWDKAIPESCEERKGLNRYFEKLKKDGTSTVKSTLNRMRGK